MKTAGIVIIVVGAWLLYTVVRSSADSSFGGINGGSWSHGGTPPPATPPDKLPPSPPLPLQQFGLPL